MSVRYGIEQLNVYAGLACIEVADLFAGRGLDPKRLNNVDMHRRSVGLPFEDPVTNAVNAVQPIVDRLTDDERDSIELLITSTESGLDLSKSVASYVHEHLGLSRHCRMFEVKQACYGATGAVQLAIGYLAAGLSPGAKALVIATDVALVDERAGYAEPATGHGAAAMLLGDDPGVLAVDLGACGLYSYETLDSARPTPQFDIADVDRSLFAYLDCLSGSVADYLGRVDGADFSTTFSYLAMHTPFAGLVRAAHRKMMRELGQGGDIDADFQHRVEPSLRYPAEVGNLCSGSVYLALASLLDHAPITAPARIGLYSYGSGCASEFFSGLVGPDAVARIRSFGIGAQLAQRSDVGYDEYLRLLTATNGVLVPRPDTTVDVEAYAQFLPVDRALLVHTGTKQYHRMYEWR